MRIILSSAINMKRRIFIAINLPEDVKNKLAACRNEWADLPVRFTKKDSLHLTIVFIGYVADEEMLDICQKVRGVAKENYPFSLRFSRICLGPPGKPPRLIWLEGEKNERLSRLKRKLEKVVFSKENELGDSVDEGGGDKKFLPHITLARIRQMEWKSLSEEEPVIDQKISLDVPIGSIEVMESCLMRGGAEYIVLESAELGKIGLAT